MITYNEKYSEDPVLRRLQMEYEYERQVSSSKLLKVTSVVAMVVALSMVAYNFLKPIL